MQILVKKGLKTKRKRKEKNKTVKNINCQKYDKKIEERKRKLRSFSASVENNDY